MRWKTKEENNPDLNSERTRTKFLFFPREFNGENRWMKFCDIVERYEIRREWIPDSGIFPVKNWHECGFSDSSYREPLRDMFGNIIPIFISTLNKGEKSFNKIKDKIHGSQIFQN